MTAVVAQKNWLPPFVMRYLALPGWMVKLSKRQDGYLNQRVILFWLQYKTHSLQMNPEFPCRSIVTPTPKLLDQRYTLRLLVITCLYFPIPLPFFQSISSSLSSHISFVSAPHLLCRRIHTWCPASMTPCLSAIVFTDNLFCHLHYTESPPRLHYHPPASLLRFLLHYLPLSRVLCRRCLSNFSDRIFFSLCIILYYTACSALLRTTFLNLYYYLLTTMLFSLLERIFSLCVMFLIRSHLPRFIHFTSLRSAPIWSPPSALSAPICLLHIKSSQLWLLWQWSDLIAPICLDQLAQICSVFRISGPSNFS